MPGNWFKKGKEADENASNLGEQLTSEEFAKLPQNLQQQVNNPNTVAVFKTPETQTSRSAFYRFNGEEGLNLPAPGKQILIIVPGGEEINLQDVYLGHRKDQKYWGDTSTEWDGNGAYTEVFVFDGNTNSWLPWKDPLGHDPVKYAERRHSVEYEKLSNYFGMVGKIRPLAFLLVSKGKGNPQMSVVTEHSFELMGYPDMHPGIKSLERNYSPGNRFVDFRDHTGPHRLPVYGGGKQHHKKGPHNYTGGPAGYPQAIPLKGKVGVEPFQMTETLSTEHEHLDEEGRLWINLPAGMRIKSLEISAGARWWNALPDPKLACKGGRKISAFVVGKDGKKKDRLMVSLNVGPQGVLLGCPTENEYLTEEGDRILIEGENHTSYVMGWRILYENDQEEKAPISNGTTATAEAAKLTAKVSLKLQPTNESVGGTQGAQWYIDQDTGEKYLCKTYEHTGSPEKAKDRCATEFIANSIYKMMGIPAPESHIQDGKIFSKEIKGLQRCPFSWSASKTANADTAKAFYGKSQSLRDGFIIDAWLANWDVFGLEYDNILKNSEGKMVRVDAGGALFYRGMGAYKPQFGNENVTELSTMRNPNMAREAGPIFKDLIQDTDIRQQVGKLKEVMTDVAITNIVNTSGISNTQQVIQTLIKRRNWLIQNYS